MTGFEPVDDVEWSDLRAFGPVEAHGRREARQAAAETPGTDPRAEALEAAQNGTGPRSVAASDLEPGMVVAGTGDHGVDRAVERVCADIEPPHTVHAWLEGIADAWLLPPDARLDLA